MAAVFLSLLVSLSAFPATLTQERRVVPTGAFTHAANYQAPAKVASNGHGFLAVWVDARAAHDPFHGAGGFLWASHFAADGTLTSLNGMKLADGVFGARIASDGNDYLVATEHSDGIYTQRFDDQGRALADAIKVDATTTPPMTLASNGGSYLLTTNKESGVQWRMLDTLGQPVGDPQIIPASTSWGDNATITTADGAYHLIYGTQACVSAQGCTFGIADVTVTNGHAGSARTLVPSSNFVGYVSAASSGDQFLLAWVAADAVTEELFDANDNPITPARKLAPMFQSPLTVGWDGARYLVAQANGFNTSAAQRVSRDGEPIDGAPFVIANRPAQPPEIARGGGRTAIVWSGAPDASPSDVYGRVVFDFNELAATATESIRLSNAAEIQHSPAVAVVAGRTIRVWRGGDCNGSIEMAIDDGDAVVLPPENSDSQHDPDVAAIGDVALIVWRSDTRARRRVFGVRVDANGTRLDPQLIAIDEDASIAVPPSLDRVSVATDGQSFLVAWSGHFVVAAKRIARDGAILDPTPIIATHLDYFLNAGVKVIWNGAMYVVVYAFEDNHLTALPFLMIVELYAARISTVGIPLDASENRMMYREFGSLTDFTAAASGNQVVIALSAVPSSGDILRWELHAVEISVNPLPLPVASRVIAQVIYPFAYGISDIGIAARGDTFLVAWSQDAGRDEKVQALLLDRGEPFVVAEPDGYDVTVIPDANGFSFTYARTDAEAGYVARLFTRELMMTPARQRAVR